MAATPPPFTIPDDVDPLMMARPELRSRGALRLFPNVSSYLDIPFAGPLGFRPLTLDLHVPDHDDGGFRPVAVYAHPGGWFLGTRMMGPWAFLLDAGIAVASLSYRLSGEASFPTPVHDVAAGVRWVHSHASEYGLDDRRVIGFGSSAGAYLISAVALMPTEMLGGVGPTPEAPCRLCAVVEHYGPSEPTHLDEDARPDTVELMDGPTSTLSRFLGFMASERPKEAAAAGLVQYVSPSAPPFLIAHGDADRRVGINQSQRLADALGASGVDVRFHIVPGADHGAPEFDQEPIHQVTLDFLRPWIAG